MEETDAHLFGCASGHMKPYCAMACACCAIDYRSLCASSRQNPPAQPIGVTSECLGKLGGGEYRIGLVKQIQSVCDCFKTKLYYLQLSLVSALMSVRLSVAILGSAAPCLIYDLQIRLWISNKIVLLLTANREDSTEFSADFRSILGAKLPGGPRIYREAPLLGRGAIFLYLNVCPYITDASTAQDRSFRS